MARPVREILLRKFFIAVMLVRRTIPTPLPSLPVTTDCDRLFDSTVSPGPTAEATETTETFSSADNGDYVLRGLSICDAAPPRPYVPKHLGECVRESCRGSTKRRRPSAHLAGTPPGGDTTWRGHHLAGTPPGGDTFGKHQHWLRSKTGVTHRARHYNGSCTISRK
ncbi:uncharacterized protein LOC122265470 [Penaeus japonicus]|uniref:uncharacterized protein LOC122265470 n=1 Tax=Penaeus japonicus TaxID=27405 RepID=UPI001C71267D|nr:uncharacterized protein LOC122265470 [Penaeus japonicus]